MDLVCIQGERGEHVLVQGLPCRHRLSADLAAQPAEHAGGFGASGRQAHLVRDRDVRRRSRRRPYLDVRAQGSLARAGRGRGGISFRHQAGRARRAAGLLHKRKCHARRLGRPRGFGHARRRGLRGGGGHSRQELRRRHARQRPGEGFFCDRRSHPLRWSPARGDHRRHLGARQAGGEGGGPAVFGSWEPRHIPGDGGETGQDAASGGLGFAFA
mmetsp:Transcript_60555/g.169117  ORF Transcript_60555/g.169117 Transcript_60555/m.169117 type:complete len:214 (-) Transcript_60555:2112-2753(-)